jgi:prevent-host-death family protein
MGRTGRAARLLPLSVDGLILAASLVLLHEARNDRDVPRLARLMLWLGIGATIGASIAFGRDTGCSGADLGLASGGVHRLGGDRDAAGQTRPCTTRGHQRASRARGAGRRPLNGPRRCRRAAPAIASVRLYSAGVTFTCPVPQAGSHLAELVDRARRSHERVVLTEHGQPAAVLISVDDLDELQRFQDDNDIALCEAINARNEPGVPHDQFMASLDMEP